jgi:polar amino acid transport system substrate-binding protein
VNNGLQLNKLIYKRLDVVPMTTLSTLYKARHNGQIDRITHLPKILVYTKLYNVLTKASTYPNKEKLIKDYDIALRNLVENGHIRAIFDKYGYKEY